MPNTRAAGRITGNPLCGLCERVCIETKKVFDGCISRIGNVVFTVPLSDFTPGTVPPFTYIGARSSGPSVITDLVITTISGRRSRLSFNVTTPITVSYSDVNGVFGTAVGNVTINRDIVLNVPEDSVVPYSVEAATSIVSTIGSFNADNTSVTITCCIIQIIRIVTVVELLVPSYGYCEYPACEEFADQTCEGVFERPLFPPSNL